MPIAPDVVARDDQGRTTVRATRLTQEIRLDGRLDEAVYQTVPAISGFIQQLPDEGALASERTDAWVFFDETSIYVSARAYDSAPPSEWVAERDASRRHSATPKRLVLRSFSTPFMTDGTGWRSW